MVPQSGSPHAERSARLCRVVGGRADEQPLPRADRNGSPECAAIDPLDDLPAESRREVVAAVVAALGVSEDNAEAIVRASEPLWDAMEEAGGLVNSWGDGDFCYLFPQMCAVIRSPAS